MRILRELNWTGIRRRGRPWTTWRRTLLSTIWDWLVKGERRWRPSRRTEYNSEALWTLYAPSWSRTSMMIMYIIKVMANCEETIKIYSLKYSTFLEFERLLSPFPYWIRDSDELAIIGLFILHLKKCILRMLSPKIRNNYSFRLHKLHKLMKTIYAHFPLKFW